MACNICKKIVGDCVGGCLGLLVAVGLVLAKSMSSFTRKKKSGRTDEIPIFTADIKNTHLSFYTKKKTTESGALKLKNALFKNKTIVSISSVETTTSPSRTQVQAYCCDART